LLQNVKIDPMIGSASLCVLFLYFSFARESDLIITIVREFTAEHPCVLPNNKKFL
jgi:hypothetical protein